ncbi:MAG: SDR family oxidoreductase [Sedimentisphaerales bacterium]|nr:SDR family oxidoreductase [Sedimentisphaerales bacterium]
MSKSVFLRTQRLAGGVDLWFTGGMDRALFDLLGRTALVTGAGRGIGLALARGLADHGADVVLVARTAEQLEAGKRRIEDETGRKAWGLPFDLSNTAGVAPFFDRVVEEVGAVDILVNCAGVNLRGTTEDVAPETFRRVMDVNLTAALMLSQAFCRHRKQVSRPGRIINIGSLLCQAARATIAAYTCSKTGLLGLTKTLAVEWAKYDINVNAIGPGYIDTELTAPLKADANFDRWVLTNTPLGRWGRPGELVGVAVLLASQAGDFITGQIFYVDGGWTALL